MNIVTTIKNETSGCLGKAAVIDGDRKFSYDDLFAAVDCAAAELSDQGIRHAHRVAFLCGDSIDYIVVSLAVLSLLEEYMEGIKAKLVNIIHDEVAVTLSGFQGSSVKEYVQSSPPATQLFNREHAVNKMDLTGHY